MEHWIETAKALGFSAAAALNPETLTAREDVRQMCAADQCGAYGKNWTCPPACGTLEECQKRMNRYSRGILVQTVGQLHKTIDSRAYRETERRHRTQMLHLYRLLRQEHDEVLCLGAGGCRLCPKCAYPEPCRFPEDAMSSMEGYGLFVTQVCRDCGLPYSYGEKTITYTGCLLF